MEQDDVPTLIGDRERMRAAYERSGPREAYVFVIAGPDVGVTFKIKEGGVVGRGRAATFSLTDPEVSREHARFSLEGPNVVIEDLGSANGTHINGTETKERHTLVDGDRVHIGTTSVFKFSFHDVIEQQFQRSIFDSALRDPLTAAYNRRYFLERLGREYAYASRHDEPLTLIMFDLDHFKQVNDTYGHLAGDYVLKTISRGVLDSVRREDTFARYGGEEFLILSRGIDVGGAHEFAERLRRWMETFPFEFEGRRLRVTTSVGIAVMPDNSIGSPQELVSAADRALYLAKTRGRNRVEVYAR